MKSLHIEDSTQNIYVLEEWRQVAENSLDVIAMKNLLQNKKKLTTKTHLQKAYRWNDRKAIFSWWLLSNFLYLSPSLCVALTKWRKFRFFLPLCRKFNPPCASFNVFQHTLKLNLYLYIEALKFSLIYSIMETKISTRIYLLCRKKNARTYTQTSKLNTRKSFHDVWWIFFLRTQKTPLYEW